MKQIRVIINADDFGLNERVNHETAELIEAGKITSVSIMANGPCFEQAVDLIHHYPGVSTGVHLNVHSGNPLRPEGLAAILEWQGQFRGTFESLAFNRNLATGIYREWCEQVKRVQKQGIEITHLDSHFHDHQKPLLFRILLAVRKRYGIRSVRITKNIFMRKDLPPVWKQIAKSGWNGALRLQRGIVTTDGFADFETIYHLLPGPMNSMGTVEAMVHPGSDLKEFEDEIELLRSEWWNRSELALELINYRQL